ncbi:MAG: ABC transporter permease subunit [Myxococcota bacterium]
MKGTIAVFKKETATYFQTPIAYVVIAVFTFIMGYFFTNLVSVFQKISVAYLRMQRAEFMEQINITDMIARPLLINMSVIMIFMIPLLTMRLFAEERKHGTYELLMTAPVTSLDIILGKYLAALFVVFIMLGVTLFYSVTLHVFAVGDTGTGQGLAWATVLASYLGAFLVGASITAIGVFMSSVTQNQIVAAVLTFTVALMLYLLNWAAQSAEGTTQTVLSYISILDHAANFSKGLIEVKSLVYYLTFIFFGLFLTYRSLEMDRHG